MKDGPIVNSPENHDDRRRRLRREEHQYLFVLRGELLPVRLAGEDCDGFDGWFIGPAWP